MDFINAIVLLLNYIFVPALSYGSQLALGAIFVSLIYGILRFAYFTAGDLMSFGTMFTILFTWYFQSLGISLGVFPTALLAIPFGIIVTIFYVLVKDKLVFSYYRFKKSTPVMLAMVSIGTMFVTQAIVRIVIGPFDRRFFDGEKFILKANEFKEMTGLNEGLTIKSTQVITLFVTIIVVSILFWFLNKTKTGKSMRAYSDNEDLALLSGIDPKRVVMITWVDLIVNPSFKPVISLNSFAFKINFSPSKNLLSKGPMIILTIAWVTNMVPILTIASITGGLFLNR